MQENKICLPASELESQEHLSLDRLNKITFAKPIAIVDKRPTSSFIDLMNWVQKGFQSFLTDQVNVNKFVQNRIIVDGQFVTFCEENNISIECLYKDSIISWKTDHGFEKFFAQGVFLIKSKEVEFIHCALFAKGNNYEDEVSFFVMVSDKNYKKYLELRNNFDAWTQERERNNSFVKVIGGEDLAYGSDYSWEDLFLPAEMKQDIKGLVETFLSSKDFYLKNKIPWKRGLLLYGPPGLGKSLTIKTIIANYNFKPVTIAPGTNEEALMEAFAVAEEQSPALLYFEDLDYMLDNIDISCFLNLMDGVSSKNGLLIIATTNDIKRLKPNISARPSRFDRKFEIALPDQQLAQSFLKKWFGNIISAKKYKELAKLAEKHKLSYAYLKELYISSMYEALSHNRKLPTEKDIDNSFNKLLKEKNNSDNKQISTDIYFQ